MIGERTVIQVEDLHKHYRLGTVGATQLNDELRAIAARMRGRPDPRRLLDAEGRGMNTTKDFWALRGVDFEVKEGETLGIVGRNGAGKSTLLKLLSRITVPTRGTIRMKGRVSSLLEVGTGFHPELTGRENIYLNGAILGMRKAEIDRKLDEIIAFSGIEHHIDTPVKRYSSGMKVRLGFAVAAHLEPEILIVDEVLAVGDAEFQRRCLGKMHEVSDSGRTVLFVSHNMTAVRNLCPRTVWLHDGVVRADGFTETIVNEYLKEYTKTSNYMRWADADKAPGNGIVRLRSAQATSVAGNNLIHWEDPIRIDIEVENRDEIASDFFVTLHIITSDENIAFVTGIRESLSDFQVPPGIHIVSCEIPGNLLNAGTYYVSVNGVHNGKIAFKAEHVLEFDVHTGALSNTWLRRRPGYFRLPLKWSSSVLGKVEG